MPSVVRPGGAYAARPLHFIWVLDTSGSMQGSKIEGLNTSIREAIPQMRQAARSNPEAQVLVRVLTFAEGARWHVAQPTPVEQFEWHDIEISGENAATDLGRALELLAEELRVPPLDPRGMAPHIAVVSDGHPSDNWKKGLEKLMAERWGRHAVRMAIAMGLDADRHVLRQFVGDPERPVLDGNDSEQLARQIRFISASVGGSLPRPAAARAAESPRVSAAGGAPAADADIW